ncbi:MAG: class I SAM-dependent methyltransferase, partial [Deltaproteobacteria bacterium]|nr:class I SAM-dependent methyltransferase [Deltaproteobacteria bacterium]
MACKTLKEKFINETYNYLMNYGIISFERNFEKERDMKLRQLIEKFYIFYEELLEWNKKINLTKITDADEFIKRHIMDSTFLLKILRTGNKRESDGVQSIMDIGSGAGFPDNFKD